MVKECKVVSGNTLVSVVDYDGKMIQVPSKYTVTGSAYIRCEKGNYSVVSKDEFLDSKKLNKPAKTKRVSQKDILNNEVTIKENV